MTDPTLRILLVDDHAILRQGLIALLSHEVDFDIVGEVDSSKEAIEQLGKLKPDILVLDISLRDISGLEVLDTVKKVSPLTRTVILSMYSDELYVQEALRRGALGYVLKDAGVDSLVLAIRAVASRRHYLCEGVSRYALNAFLRKNIEVQTPNRDDLTNREREVVTLAAQGHTASEVAQRLGISARTAETHRSRAMKKLGIKSQSQLFQYAVLKGLLTIRPDGPASNSSL